MRDANSEEHLDSSQPGDKPSCTAMERALLLAFALKWRKETDTLTAEQLREFEKEIWLSHIHATIVEMESVVSERDGGRRESEV